MKVLKILGIILLVIIALVVILGIFAPKKYSVERSVLINAPKELVFDHVKYWKNWQAWSPWAAQDSAMKVTIVGTDGEPGSAYQWTGDPKLTGSGKMSNTGISELSELEYHLHFIKPWESHSDGYVRLDEEAGGSKVSWGFYGENPFPWNMLMLFMSMDKMIGKDFETGLGLLKGICEKEAAAVLSYEVKVVDFGPKKYAAIRKVVPFSGVTEFFAKSYGTIMQSGVRMTGSPVGIYYSWDEAQKTSDMAAAIPIAGTVSGGAMTSIAMPKSRAFCVDYYGAYDGSGPAHRAFDLYFKKNGLTAKMPVIEEYITDPGTEPDTSKWLTKIYYFAE